MVTVEEVVKLMDVGAIGYKNVYVHVYFGFNTEPFKTIETDDPYEFLFQDALRKYYKHNVLHISVNDYDIDLYIEKELK